MRHRFIATGTHLLIAAALLGAPAVHGARQTSDDARFADLYDGQLDALRASP